MTKKDMVLAAILLGLGAAVFLWFQLSHRAPAKLLEVTVDGTVVETLDLEKDGELTITSPSGGSNHLIIQEKTAWVSEASCPDKICVHQGKISRDGEMIVCLPNRLVIQIKGVQP